MPTWFFRGAEERTACSFTHRWYWAIESAETPIAITSARVFPTLDECVANARAHGFFGSIEVPETITYPALITCEAPERRRKPWREAGTGRAYRAVR